MSLTHRVCILVAVLALLAQATAQEAEATQASNPFTDINNSLGNLTSLATFNQQVLLQSQKLRTEQTAALVKNSVEGLNRMVYALGAAARDPIYNTFNRYVDTANAAGNAALQANARLADQMTRLGQGIVGSIESANELIGPASGVLSQIQSAPFNLGTQQAASLVDGFTNFNAAANNLLNDNLLYLVGAGSQGVNGAFQGVQDLVNGANAGAIFTPQAAALSLLNSAFPATNTTGLGTIPGIFTNFANSVAGANGTPGMDAFNALLANGVVGIPATGAANVLGQTNAAFTNLLTGDSGGVPTPGVDAFNALLANGNALLTNGVAGIPAPGTLLTAAGIPAPGSLLTAAGIPIPAPGSLLTAAGIPIPAPGSLLQSAGIPAPGTLLQADRAALLMAGQAGTGTGAFGNQPLQGQLGSILQGLTRPVPDPKP